MLTKHKPFGSPTSTKCFVIYNVHLQPITVAVMMLILRFGPRVEDDPEDGTEFISEHAVMDELTFDEENAEAMSPLRLPSVGYGSTKDLSGKSASMRRSTHSHFSRSAHVRASLKD
ncbi:predicted protein [Chaetoceros tenuissimus]|uniref:Uncharacterized protein n=1 Tax=Chaetoceros tenuissimus TaxID=426638 RepID=A0AAD3H8A3_9STRA|nr:predicted protein [Chaetoceros tenuissimus]